jgi:hypothetical protein
MDVSCELVSLSYSADAFNNLGNYGLGSLSDTIVYNWKRTHENESRIRVHMLNNAR